MTMIKRRIFIVVAALALLALSVFVSKQLTNSRPNKPEPAHIEKIRYVKAQAISYQNTQAHLQATGRIGSLQSVDVIAEAQGKILAGDRPLKKGQQFKKGELLLKIFETEARLNLQARKSSFLNMLANILPDLKIDFRESYPLWQSYFEQIDINAPLPELPEIKNSKEKIFLSSRGILGDFFSIQSDEIRLEKHRIYAPFNGTFIEVFLETGSVANPGSRIAKIIRTDKLELEVPVDAQNISFIHKGSPVDIYSETDNHWKGAVNRISGFVDPTTQSISVFVSVYPNKDQALYTGQYLRAEFSSKDIPATMEIPRSAVFDENFVYTVDKGLLKKCQVKVHKTNNNTLIFSGLPEGTKVVTEPLVNARENQQVSILN